jgi:phosphoenolpyruvate carboxylase
MYETLHPTATETLSYKLSTNKINQLLGHKAHLNNSQRADKIQRKFSDHIHLSRKFKTSVSQKKRRKFPYSYKFELKIYRSHMVKEVIKMQIRKQF